jgi:acetolactate synthase-1/2/3 large subunit
VHPDFIRYAGIYEACRANIKKIKDLMPILQDGTTRKVANLIELPVDYSENERVLIKELEKNLPALMPRTIQLCLTH